MSSATILEVMQAVASQLESEIDVDGLQVDPLLNKNPTPPCLDVYPGDPFGEATTFNGGREQLFTIRARVSTADHEAGQELLLSLMDHGPSSVIAAIAADRTLAGTVDDALVEGPSGYIEWRDTDNAGGLLGCEWRLRVER